MNPGLQVRPGSALFKLEAVEGGDDVKMNMDYPSKSVLSWKLDGYSTNPDDDADVEEAEAQADTGG